MTKIETGSTTIQLKMNLLPGSTVFVIDGRSGGGQVSIGFPEHREPLIDALVIRSLVQEVSERGLDDVFTVSNGF